MTRLDDYSMRVLGTQRIPRMTSDRQTFSNPIVRSSGVRAHLCATEGYGFFLPASFTGFSTEMSADALLELSPSGMHDNYHDRPQVIMGDGFFTLQLEPGVTAYNRARGVPFSSPPMFIWFFATG